MNFENFGSTTERTSGPRAPRIRAGAIVGASIVTGVATAVAAAVAIGPFASLRPDFKVHFVQSTHASRTISAQTLFPKPGPVVKTMPRPYTFYSQPPSRQHSGPPTVIDDLPVPVHVEVNDGSGGQDR